MTLQCTLCGTQLDERSGDYLRRGSCGHHVCLPCALPLIYSGKAFCSRCPAPQRPTQALLGNLVLGGDREHTASVLRELRQERSSQVRALEPAPTEAGASPEASV